MSANLFDSLVADSMKAIAPLRDAVTEPGALEVLLAQVGLDAESAGGDGLAIALQSIVSLADDIEQLAGAPGPSFSGIEAILEALRGVVVAVRGLSGSDGPAAEFETFGGDLVDVLLIQYLWNWHPLLHELAVLATLVEPAGDVDVHPAVVQDGLVVRAPFAVERLRIGQLGALIENASTALRAEYGNPLATVDDANAMADKLFPRVLGVLRTLGVACRYGFDPADTSLLGDSASFVDHALIVYTADQLAGAAAEAGLVITISSADRGDLGFVFTPFGFLSETRQLGNWNLELDLTADVQGFAVGRHGVTILAGLDTVDVTGKLTANLMAPDVGPAYLVGSATGSHIEVGGMTLAVQSALSTERQVFSTLAKVSKAAIVIASSDGDGFIQSVLPRDGLRTEFDLGILWSNSAGLHIDGAAGLDATLPAGVTIAGVVTVSSVHVGLQATDSGAEAEISASLIIAIGPIRAVADRIGITASLASSEAGGNLGAAELAFSFKAPSGIGVIIDAATVTGGGFLEHSGDQYSGALDLSICGYAVKAFGLVQTSQPGGQPGYSFVAVISVEFAPEIDLPFDFTLKGVGGLLGVNRTISVDAVEAALWAHHLDGLLFPADPVAAAPQLISALGSYFPPAEGRYVFGPLAKIGWAADIVTGEAALLLELPEPVKLLLIGEVQVSVPSGSPQLVLHISFDGGVDFGKQLAFFDASLHDSRLESYPISGDLAFRYSWGDQAVFALALGGFNPQFQPPAGFPTLKRLAISIHSSIARIEAQSYLALTSNTLQFGARVELTAGTGSFNVHGWLGFDALCERNPLMFEFDLSAGVDLRAGSDVIASVHLDGKLSGPTPWHIAGNASLSLLFFDVTVHFDKTWGSTAAALPAPDPLPALSAALADRSSWSGALPAGVRAAITPVGSSDAREAILLDPAGTLRVSQRVVPLDQPISRFAGTPLGQSTTFTVSLTFDSVSAVGNPTTPSATISEEFAPAQFFDLTDAEKLSLPSFSRFDAGVELAGEAIDLGQSTRTRAVITPISYITTTIDSRPAPPQPPYFPTVTAVLALNDSTDSPPPGLGRYRPAVGTPARVTLAPEQWTIASTSDLTVRADIPTDGSKLTAHLALEQYLAANPGEVGALQVVLTQETA